MDEAQHILQFNAEYMDSFNKMATKMAANKIGEEKALEIIDKYFIVDNGSTNGSQLLLHEGKSIFLEGTMSFVLGNKQFKIEEKK